MKYILRSALFFAIALSCLLLPAGKTRAEEIKLESSTQFIWGDDWLGDGQAILAEYLKLGYASDGKFSITGYGRLWQDLNSGGLRDDDFSGRLYYLYLDYRPINELGLRIGRQYVNFTAGSAIMDGFRLDVDRLGPVGLRVAAGSEVRYSIDSEHSRLGDYFLGGEVHLTSLKPLSLAVSYAREYDEWDNSREHAGASARLYFGKFSPYAEAAYDIISEVIDEATAGVDIYPTDNLYLNLEFYHMYPTFDSTSIYSVFAVDRYQEYLIRAEYDFSPSLTGLASYRRQMYMDGDDEEADLVSLGAVVRPGEDLTLSGLVDFRTGMGGKLWGFELYGDYRVGEALSLAAGAQYNIYRREVLGSESPEEFPDDPEEWDYATRLWVAASMPLRKDISLAARFEANIDESFSYRPAGYVIIGFKL